MSLSATSASSGPSRLTGLCEEKETALVTPLPGSEPTMRASVPVVVVRTPGVPSSAKSWAEKCDRVTL